MKLCFGLGELKVIGSYDENFVDDQIGNYNQTVN